MGRLCFVMLLAALLPGTAATGAETQASAEPAPLAVTEVAAGVFVSVAPYELATPANADQISNTGFVIGTEAVAVIDTGGSLTGGQRLLAAIRQKTNLPIRYVINTHDHPDHVFGNAAFKNTGAIMVGHANLPRAMADRAAGYLEATRDLIGEAAFAGTEAISPTLLVRNRMTLDVGGRRVLLEAWPTAHTDTDLTVLDERTGTWFLGDLLFFGHVPALDGSLKGWLAAIDRLKQRPAERVVPGHGPATLPWPAGLAPTETYLRVLEADIRHAIALGRSMRQTADEAAGSERGRWFLFDAFNARNAIAAFHELEWE